MVFLTLAETGMRPSECLALRWDDVDIARRRLRIERAVTLGGEIKPTKTKAARTVPLTVPLMETLGTWHRRVERITAKAKASMPQYLFPSRTGRPLQAKPLGRRFRAVLRKAGLPSVLTLYSFRHTFCSELLDQGVKPVDVAKLLGHSVATLYQFYAHSIPQDDTPHIDRLTEAWQKGK
jgi:integrase